MNRLPHCSTWKLLRTITRSEPSSKSCSLLNPELREWLVGMLTCIVTYVIDATVTLVILCIFCIALPHCCQRPIHWSWRCEDVFICLQWIQVNSIRIELCQPRTLINRQPRKRPFQGSSGSYLQFLYMNTGHWSAWIMYVPLQSLFFVLCNINSSIS